MTYRRLALLSGVLAALPLGDMAMAQIDCARATRAIDKAICASPALIEQDKALAEAYRQALRRVPGQSEQIRQAQRRWITERGRQCGAGEGAALEACLSETFAARIAVLSPTPTPQPPLAVAQPPAAPAWPAALPLPTAPLPPGPPVTKPEARLRRDTLPSAGPGETLLDVLHPGRFTIRAESPTGTALQLVDMLTGPGDESGAPGAADGRLDLLLDRGTYKIRTRGAENARGDTRLSATPFADVAPPAVLRPGDRLGATLGDAQQRAFWFTVEKQRTVRIEAAGRALRDLRLWREGRDLVPAEPLTTTIAPTSGHTLNRILLTPELEPGTYLVTAYGGPALPWADGDPAQPFHLRLDGLSGLVGGWVSGVIGPFGSEVFDITSQASRFRLSLPEPAAARLELLTNGHPEGATLQPDRRDPAVTINSRPRQDDPRTLTVLGQEGQPFQLRAFGGDALYRQPGAGTYLVLSEAVGAGGDEVPATIALRRDENGKDPVIIGGSAPRIGPGQAWRGRFNLRGSASLLVEVTAPGPVAVHTQGVSVATSIQLLSTTRTTPPAQGDAQRGWDLSPGWYRLSLEPPGDASGILDVTVGPPGLIPPDPSPAQPPDPLLLLGQHRLAEGQRITFYGNGRNFGLVARPLPLDLTSQPLIVSQMPGEAVDIPLSSRPAGEVTARRIGGGTAGVRILPGNPATLHLDPPQAPRTVILSWPAEAAPVAMPRPRPLPGLGTLGSGEPVFLTLGRDEQRSFALRVPEGGLYRVETLGRLRTKGSLGTAFLPDLGSAEANGTGANMLLLHYLRAGDYRLSVGAVNSSGRLGIVARPAPLAEGTLLLSGGTVRAMLPAGSGIAFPIEISEAGDYKLDLPSLGREITARLEDAEGWPLMPVGALDGLVRDFQPGHYRLVILPADVESRVVARLTPMLPPREREGHGPFALAFHTPTAHQWREPARNDAPRTPDQWNFSLAGPANITLRIDNGMAATLLRLEVGTPGRVAALADGTPFAGPLEAGEYRVEAAALGRNDRLDYSIFLDAGELQPDAPRTITLPASLPFAIATDRVVSLTSFGATPLRATLRDEAGRALALDEGQAEDWNIATSRLLPAGRYTLDLAAITTEMFAVPRPRADESGEMEESEDTIGASGEEEEADSSSMASEESEPDEATPRAVTLRLSLPEAREPVAADTTGTQVLEQGGVHRLSLPAIPDGSLILVRAEGSETLVLGLERQEADGRWRGVTTDRGTAPVVAVPGLPGVTWRASVWSVSGGTAPIRVTTRLANPPPQQPGQVIPTPVEGLPGLYLAEIDAPGSTVLSVRGEGLRHADAAGRGLLGLEDGQLVPQAGRVWLLAAAATPLAVEPLPATPDRATILSLPAGDTATLQPPADGMPHLWLARQDGPAIALQAGRGMGVATGSTLALGSEAALRVTNGLSRDTSRVALSLLRPTLTREQTVADATAPLLPAGTAQPLRLPPGPKRLRLDLAPGTAAILGWPSADAVTLWPGDAAGSHLIEGEWTALLLVNTTAAPAPASLALSPLDAPPLPLRPGQPLRRFLGAAGTWVLPVAASAGHRIAVAGATARFIGADGHIAEGARLAPGGPGWLVLEHGPGPVVAWLEGEGVTPWPPGDPRPVALPRQLRLTGESMALALSPDAPLLLHARTTAPVVLALGEDAPRVFPAGAEFHRYLPAGTATLRLMPPQDGPLTGALDLSATPILPAEEGLGAPVMVGPGNSVLFGFDVPRGGWVGLGIRAEPDQATVRLLDAQGVEKGRGIAQLQNLPAGRYIIEASIPPDATATAIRPALLGLTPRPAGPPPDIARRYREMAGLTPAAPR